MKRLLTLLLCLCTFVGFAAEPAESGEKGGAFNPGEIILHHVADSHEWHWFSTDNGNFVTYLPIIAYQPGKGVAAFSSEKVAEGKTYGNFKLEDEKLVAIDGSKVYDFSITKNVAALAMSSLLLVFIFSSVAKSYRSRVGQAPSGLQSLLEPFIVFIRDEVGKKSIGPKYERYMPYLLTVFFFIWFNNLLGLTPGAANLSGNIAVTMALAVVTLLITLFSANKNYWGHIFAPPGVPWPLYIIMVPVELIGVLVKPFSLMIRLFANITAGHIIILSFISLIFIFRSAATGLISVPFGLFISLLELLVSILQAYIFTLLTAMYIGGAVEEHHHEEEHGHGEDFGTAEQRAGGSNVAHLNRPDVATH
ncbi:F0F1 ATP synthase subunit A [Hymenobacter sp. HMF4947]|uniref:ATP synthase subunit a n=1 Tax=Hymenobacter ginkgonis TaxID=2682976 RepID=A0A7K1TDJ5_9BACT|nr:F0F1 ATP synthase subunit A [Hymenobacter ginkgonis]MVN76476.1 F0F1 ATP synthase subunit A [Hymenobacter ginkgonis]